MNVLLDTGPLREHRDFRLLWIGQGVTFLGSMITYVAVPYQLYRLTGSPAAVGPRGPGLGGLLIAGFGIAATYAADVATFAVSLTALWLMKAVPPPPDAPRPSVRGVLEGLAYARSRPELIGTYLVDINATFFGMPNA